MKPIVVLGSLNADLVSRSARLPATGETVTGSLFATYPGGKGANQAVAAARLGGQVCMLGAVGEDAFAPMLLDSLQTAGVDHRAVDRLPGNSGVALINTDDAGNNRIVVVPGANQQVSTAYVRKHRSLIEGAAILLLQLEIPLESVILAASIARQARVPVILDPAPARPLPHELLQSVTWLTPNDSEADTLMGTSVHETEQDPTHRTKLLLALGASNVVLKRGKFGANIATSDGHFDSVDAYQVSAVDTTAAGDAFNAGFAVGLAKGQSPTAALSFAAAVAAISVTREGAQPSMPTLEEVESFLKAHQRS